MNDLNFVRIGRSFAEWQKDPGVPGCSEASLYLFDLSREDYDPESLSTFLTEPELARADRYRQEADRASFLVRRAALRILLSEGRSDPRSILITEGVQGKPKADARLHFNCSHSSGLILIGLSHAEIGVDLEVVRSRFDYQDILDVAFAPAERDFIFNANHPDHVFFELWSRKEAIVKAAGTGINDHLTAIPCIEGIHMLPSEFAGHQDWDLISLQLDDAFASICAKASSKHSFYRSTIPGLLRLLQ